MILCNLALKSLLRIYFIVKLVVFKSKTEIVVLELCPCKSRVNVPEQLTDCYCLILLGGWVFRTWYCFACFVREFSDTISGCTRPTLVFWVSSPRQNPWMDGRLAAWMFRLCPRRLQWSMCVLLVLVGPARYWSSMFLWPLLVISHPRSCGLLALWWFCQSHVPSFFSFLFECSELCNCNNVHEQSYHVGHCLHLACCEFFSYFFLKITGADAGWVPSNYRYGRSGGVREPFPYIYIYSTYYVSYWLWVWV